MTSIALAVLCCLKVNAQNIGINATGATPDASSMLDVSATNKGLLIPRVSLSTTADVTTIAAPATSLLVYNTNTAITGTGANGAGFYYWNGTNWVNLMVFGTATSDHDWYKQGTSTAPTSINDSMFHLGNTAMVKTLQMLV